VIVFSQTFYVYLTYPIDRCRILRALILNYPVCGNVSAKGGNGAGKQIWYGRLAVPLTIQARGF